MKKRKKQKQTPENLLEIFDFTTTDRPNEQPTTLTENRRNKRQTRLKRREV